MPSLTETRFRIHFRVAVWVVVLFVAFAAAPPALALEPSRALTQYLHRIWQVPQGLPQPTVNAIGQTPDGFLWLATPSGMVRFDGIRFTPMGPFGPRSAGGVWASGFAVDRAGVVWVATDGTGVMSLGRDGVRRFGVADGLPSADVQSICVAADRSTWAFTAAGVARFSRNQWRLIAMPSRATADIRVALATPDENIWFAGSEPVVNQIDYSGRLVSQFRIGGVGNDVIVRALCVDNNGVLWIGTSRGLVRREPDGKQTRFTVADGLSSDTVYSLFAGRDGSVWIGTRDGFCRWRSGQSIESFRATDGLSQSTVYSVFEDAEGSLWVGTKHGLNQFSDRRIVPFTRSEGLASNDAGPLAQSADGAVWAGTLGAGLSRFDGVNFRTLGPADGLCSGTIRALAPSADGSLWIGTDRGLDRLDRLHVVRHVNAGDVRSIMVDGDAIFVGTSRGLGTLADGTIAPLELPDGPSAVREIGFDGRHRLVVATDRDCFVRSAGGLFAPLDPRRVIAGADSIMTDRAGRLYIGTDGNGLFVQDGRGMHAMTAHDGLFDDSIYGMVNDDGGRLWMACSKGVFFVTIDDLVRCASGAAASVASRPFSPTDAQRTVECQSSVQPAVLRSADGRIWFSTIHGLIVIDPARLLRPLPPPPVQVESILVNGKPETAAAIDAMSPGQKNMEFDYTALSFLSPARIEFRYQLSGFDKDWIAAGTRRQAFYTNLPPGKFTFRVQAAQSDGSFGTPDSGVAFTLGPALWQRVWFWPSAAILAAGLIWQPIRRRGQRLREHFAVVTAERARIARELHDTLLQGFSGVTMEMQALSKGLNDRDQRRTLDEIISDAAECMRDARRSLAGLRSGRPASARGLAAALTETGRQLSESAGIRLSVQASADDSNSLSQETEYELLKIATEAMHNAVKHSAARSVNVLMQSDARLLRLSVSDDGIGFDPTEVRGQHYGLIGMHERAGHIRAKLSIDSRPGRGTRVELTLPVREPGRGDGADQ